MYSVQHRVQTFMPGFGNLRMADPKALVPE